MKLLDDTTGTYALSLLNTVLFYVIQMLTNQCVVTESVSTCPSEVIREHLFLTLSVQITV